MSQLKKAVFKLHIDAPIEAVWEAIVREGEVLPYFYNSMLHTPMLKPGSPMRMRSKDGKYTGVVGDILIVERPRRFSHTFKFTNFDDPPCRVTYELESAQGGTDLVMLLDDMPAGTKTERYMMSGGPFITQTLKGVVETGRPPLRSRLFLALIGALSFTTPKKCLTKNWPFEKSIR